jgi:hypothetical protein
MKIIESFASKKRFAGTVTSRLSFGPTDVRILDKSARTHQLLAGMSTS